MNILCIDDDGERFEYLRRLICDRRRGDVVIVAGCASCIAKHLPAADVVLLDYDLDSGRLCDACGGWIEQVKSIEYVPAVIARNVPVIVVSCSAPENVRRLVTDLRRGGAVVAQHSAFEPECELRWLGRMMAWGLV